MEPSFPASLLRDLEGALIEQSLITEPDQLEECGRDFWAFRGMPGAAVRPRHARDVSEALRIAHTAGVPVVTRSAGTNIGVGFRPTPDCLMLDLRSMAALKRLDPEARQAVVEPGMLNGDLRALAAPHGLVFSPDPASSAISSIGGNIAENAGGPHCLKYGVTYHHIEALQVCLADGTERTFSASDPGADLLGLLIGSEGTLAVITEATVRLRSLPEVTRTFLAVFDDAQAATDAVSAIIAEGILPAALEFFDQAACRMFEAAAPSGYPSDAQALLLIDLDGPTNSVARDMTRIEPLLTRHAREVRRADDDAERAALWRGRIYGARSFLTSGRDYHIGDIVVPRQHLSQAYRDVTQIAERLGLTLIVNGHAGDGNLHPTIFYDVENASERARVHEAVIEMARAALRYGGTITGEHGIGEEKRDLMRLRFAPTEIAAQRTVKDVYDPNYILNPGVLLPERTPDEPDLPTLRGWLHTCLAGQLPSWRQDQTLERSPEPEMHIEIDRDNLAAQVPVLTTAGELRQALSANHVQWSAIADIPDAATVGEILQMPAARHPVRQTLLGVEAALHDGTVVRFGSAAKKDVAGYDLKRLFIGTGADVGITTRITVSLEPSTRS